MKQSPESPCIGICELDHNDLCSGCLRSREEITAWFTATDQDKQRILEKVAIRQIARPEPA